MTSTRRRDHHITQLELGWLLDRDVGDLDAVEELDELSGSNLLDELSGARSVGSKAAQRSVDSNKRSLFNHLVGAAEHRLRNSNAERVGGI